MARRRPAASVACGGPHPPVGSARAVLQHRGPSVGADVTGAVRLPGDPLVGALPCRGVGKAAHLRVCGMVVAAVAVGCRRSRAAAVGVGHPGEAGFGDLGVPPARSAVEGLGLLARPKSAFGLHTAPRTMGTAARRRIERRDLRLACVGGTGVQVGDAHFSVVAQAAVAPGAGVVHPPAPQIIRSASAVAWRGQRRSSAIPESFLLPQSTPPSTSNRQPRSDRRAASFSQRMQCVCPATRSSAPPAGW